MTFTFKIEYTQKRPDKYLWVHLDQQGRFFTAMPGEVYRPINHVTPWPPQVGNKLEIGNIWLIPSRMVQVEGI